MTVFGSLGFAGPMPLAVPFAASGTRRFVLDVVDIGDLTSVRVSATTDSWQITGATAVYKGTARGSSDQDPESPSGFIVG